jgi:succinyl-diaminopimelate desuccinylase
LLSRLEDVLHRHGVDFALAVTAHGVPFLTPKGRLVDIATQAIRDVAAVTPALSCEGGTSDGRYIARICPEVVEIGPVNATIHKLDECVALADLEPLAEIYGQVLARLLLDERR